MRMVYLIRLKQRVIPFLFTPIEHRADRPFPSAYFMQKYMLNSYSHKVFIVYAAEVQDSVDSQLDPQLLE